jgi:hypothetical protein
VAAFSLVIYFWAMQARLPREDMLALVEEQADQGPEPMAEFTE